MAQPPREVVQFQVVILLKQVYRQGDDDTGQCRLAPLAQQGQQGLPVRRRLVTVDLGQAVTAAIDQGACVVAMPFGRAAACTAVRDLCGAAKQRQVGLRQQAAFPGALRAYEQVPWLSASLAGSHAGFL